MSKGINAIYNFPSKSEVESFYRMVRYGLIPHEEYGKRVVELLQGVFIPMKRHVYEKYWNDSFIKAMPCVYTWTDHVNFWEFHIPTAINGGFMCNWRMAVKIVDEVDMTVVKRAEEELAQPWISPNGIIDSETIFIIAQRRKGLVKGYKHKRNGFVYVIVDPEPENAVKKLLALTLNFLYNKRYLGLLRKLGFYQKGMQYLHISIKEWLDQSKKHLINRILKLSNIYERLHKYSLIVRRIALSFFDGVNWLFRHLHWVEEEHKCRRLLKSAFKPVKKQILSIYRLWSEPNPLRSSRMPTYVKKLLSVVDGG